MVFRPKYFLLATERMAGILGTAGSDLEEAGACIMTRRAVSDVGIKLGDCGRRLEMLSREITELAPGQSESKESSQRMAYAAQQMIEAGNELQGLQRKSSKGKSWLKQK